MNIVAASPSELGSQIGGDGLELQLLSEPFRRCLDCSIRLLWVRTHTLSGWLLSTRLTTDYL